MQLLLRVVVPGQAKVNDLDSVAGLCQAQDVLGLQIQVQNILGMNKGYSFANLFDERRARLLRQLELVIDDPFKEFAAVDAVRDVDRDRHCLGSSHPPTHRQSHKQKHSLDLQFEQETVGGSIAEGVDDLNQSWMLQFGHNLNLAFHVQPVLLLRTLDKLGGILGFVICVSCQEHGPEFTTAKNKINAIQRKFKFNKLIHNHRLHLSVLLFYSLTDRPSSRSVISYKSFGRWSTRNFTSRLRKVVEGSKGEYSVTEC